MNPEQLRNFYSHGSPDPLPARTPLRAGPFSMCFEAGDLRYIKLGEREVIRRIYAAVRDRNWGTVPGAISDLEQKIGRDNFYIRYGCEHRQNDIHFVWTAEIAGEADGAIRFTFDGEAKSTFLRNRIGFCVLHPIQCAGAKCRAIYANGSEKESVFPKIIAAEQPVTSLHDLAGIAHELQSGVWAELRFEGDLFETEDQRNWIDASFKTFCTPLRLPYPIEIKAGTHIRQQIDFRLDGYKSGSVSISTQQTPIQVTCKNDTKQLPAIGLVWAGSVGGVAEIEFRRLAELILAHLRVDLRASDSRSITDLHAACKTSQNSALELAIHLDDWTAYGTPAAYLDFIGTQLHDHVGRIARILVFGGPNDDSTPVDALAAVRSTFQHRGIPIGAGTNADLYQLNLQRPPADADFICWSMNPQVHAFDCASIAETPAAAAEQVASVREYFPGKPLVVSPVTLKPRFNPVATGPEHSPPSGELPADVDPRQLSLFGASWTLAMIKAVAEAGAESVTFYETIGWRGVMETETGSTCPEKFPSIPGTVFPLYHVLADVGEFANGEVIPTETPNSLAIVSLLLHKQNFRRLILANLSRDAQTITFPSIGQPVRARTLDLTNVHSAMNAPERFRSSTGNFIGTELKLEAYAVAAIDFVNR